nr:MAG TPA: hypothetical protein [Bacteriophage sp.]
MRNRQTGFLIRMCRTECLYLSIVIFLHLKM